MSANQGPTSGSERQRRWEARQNRAQESERHAVEQAERRRRLLEAQERRQEEIERREAEREAAEEEERRRRAERHAEEARREQLGRERREAEERARAEREADQAARLQRESLRMMFKQVDVYADSLDECDRYWAEDDGNGSEEDAEKMILAFEFGHASQKQFLKEALARPNKSDLLDNIVYDLDYDVGQYISSAAAHEQTVLSAGLNFLSKADQRSVLGVVISLWKTNSPRLMAITHLCLAFASRETFGNYEVVSLQELLALQQSLPPFSHTAPPPDRATRRLKVAFNAVNPRDLRKLAHPAPRCSSQQIVDIYSGMILAVRGQASKDPIEVAQFLFNLITPQCWPSNVRSDRHKYWRKVANDWDIDRFGAPASPTAAARQRQDTRRGIEHTPAPNSREIFSRLIAAHDNHEKDVRGWREM